MTLEGTETGRSGCFEGEYEIRSRCREGDLFNQCDLVMHHANPELTLRFYGNID